MAQRGIFFAGKQILIPGAYATYRSLAPVPVNVAATNVVALVGTAMAGQPYEPAGVGNRDFDVVKAIFRGGDLVDAAECAMYPAGRGGSSELTPGASDYVFVRVGDAVGGKLEAKNNAGVKVGDWVHRNFGVFTNGTQLAVSAGLAAGTVRAIVQDLGLNLREESPDIGPCLLVNYAGNGTAALTIDANGFTMTVTPAASSPDASATFAVQATNESVTTISQLATYISAQPKFTVTQLGSPSMLWKQLDYVSAAAVNSVGLTVSALAYGAVADWTNRNSRLVKFDIAANAPLNSPIKQHAFTNLAGGTDGVVNLAGWTQAFNKLKNQPVYAIVPIITQPAGMSNSDFATLEAQVRDLAITHTLQARDVKTRKERVLFLGHQRGLITDDANSPGTPVVTALGTISQSLNSEGICFFSPGFTRTLASGRKVLNSYFLAAIAAGAKCGAPPQRPLTLREILVEELEADFPSTVQEQLIKLGISYAVADRGKVVFGIGQTSWLQDFDPVKSEPSLIHIGDTLNKTARDHLQARHGGKEFQGSSHIEAFKSDFLSILEEAKSLGMIVDSVDPTTNQLLAAYRDVKVTFSNRRWSASAVVTAAEPGNYITIEFGFAGAGQATV